MWMILKIIVGEDNKGLSFFWKHISMRWSATKDSWWQEHIKKGDTIGISGKHVKDMLKIAVIVGIAFADMISEEKLD